MLLTSYLLTYSLTFLLTFLLTYLLTYFFTHSPTDLQEKFMNLVQDLPDVWQQKHGVFPGTMSSQPQSRTTSAAHSPAKPDSADDRRDTGGIASRDREPNGQGGNGRSAAVPRTPLSLLARASDGAERDTDEAQHDAIRRSRFGGGGGGGPGSGGSGGGRQPQPWSSPSLRSSPTDQLIAAILDGDVQGIRAVVRSKGDDLRSDFWRELSRSVLPLHRAVSGLHFHGSEKLLVGTIDTLAQLGADVNAVDHAGNTVLHKAIQVCTSKSAAAVVNTLLRRGANPTLRNKDGDSPLHSECKR